METSYGIRKTIGVIRFAQKRRTISELCFKILTDFPCMRVIQKTNPFGCASKGSRLISLEWQNWAYDGINSPLKIVYGNEHEAGLNP
jgi:hypothetical protein